MSGIGTMHYYNGDVYTGHWLRSKRHGKGTYITNKGDKFVVDWVDDKMSDYGHCYKPVAVSRNSV
eukprot:gene35017-43177_t